MTLNGTAPTKGPVFHRGGGTIESVTHVGHETYRGVATWFFVGSVRWRDGSYSRKIDIAPYQLCHDDTPASEQHVHELLGMLNRYLLDRGTWHEPVHTRDGRVYTWTPFKPEGRAELPL